MNSTGTGYTFTLPVASVLIKCSGGQCYFKRSSSIADGDAYVMDDGETINLDVAFPFDTPDGSSPFFLKAVSVDVTINLIMAY